MFSAALVNDVVSAAHPAISVLVSNSSSPYYNYLNGAGQRLERHTADIQKGFAVIIVSGEPPLNQEPCIMMGKQACACSATLRVPGLPSTTLFWSSTKTAHMGRRGPDAMW